jgi:hypothetical protein
MSVKRDRSSYEGSREDRGSGVQPEERARAQGEAPAEPWYADLYPIIFSAKDWESLITKGLSPVSRARGFVGRLPRVPLSLHPGLYSGRLLRRLNTGPRSSILDPHDDPLLLATDHGQLTTDKEVLGKNTDPFR